MSISILLPNYNHGKYIRQNISGILNQTYQDWELIIVDDGSIDDSIEIIKDYATKDSRIKPIFFEKNQGVSAAVLAAMNASQGDFLYGSASDDYVCNPLFFQMAIDNISLYSAAGYFARAKVIDAVTGETINVMGGAPEEGYIGPRDALEAFLKGEIFIPGVSAIWKKALIEKCGGFDPLLGPQSDYFVNHALPAMGGVIYNNVIVASARQLHSSFSSMVDDKIFFERHALVEKKIRMLALDYDFDRNLFRNWRAHIINARVATNCQDRIYKVMNEQSETLKAWISQLADWERATMEKELLEMVKKMTVEFKIYEIDFRKKLQSANDIFDQISGLS